MHSNKVDLTLASFRDNEGRPVVLECVKKAQALLLERGDTDHEYLPVQGSEAFMGSAVNIAFGEDYSAIKEKRIATMQSLSGTGAIRLGLEFCKKFLEKSSINPILQK